MSVKDKIIHTELQIALDKEREKRGGMTAVAAYESMGMSRNSYYGIPARRNPCGQDMANKFAAFLHVTPDEILSMIGTDVALEDPVSYNSENTNSNSEMPSRQLSSTKSSSNTTNENSQNARQSWPLKNSFGTKLTLLVVTTLLATSIPLVWERIPSLLNLNQIKVAEINGNKGLPCELNLREKVRNLITCGSAGQLTVTGPSYDNWHTMTSLIYLPKSWKATARYETWVDNYTVLSEEHSGFFSLKPGYNHFSTDVFEVYTEKTSNGLARKVKGDMIRDRVL